jgi:hypothetical protein
LTSREIDSRAAGQAAEITFLQVIKESYCCTSA